MKITKSLTLRVMITAVSAVSLLSALSGCGHSDSSASDSSSPNQAAEVAKASAATPPPNLSTIEHNAAAQKQAANAALQQYQEWAKAHPNGK
jgi:hypothetical protein